MISQEDRAIAAPAMLLAALPDAARDAVFARAHARDFDRGETIFLQGEPADSVALVLSGWVKIYRIAPTGAEAVVSVFTRGQSFAEACAFRDIPYPVSAEAATEARVLMLPASAFLHEMREDPQVAMALVGAVFGHLHGLVWQIEQLKARSGAQRVAEFLCGLAETGGGGQTVTLPYDKSLLAGRLGMKPESLSRAFSRLREVGVSVRANRAAIADMKALRDFAERDRATAWERAG